MADVVRDVEEQVAELVKQRDVWKDVAGRLGEQLALREQKNEDLERELALATARIEELERNA